MIDSIRAELEDRLRELTGEADKLRRALAALGPDGGASRTSRSRSTSATGTGSARGSGSRARRTTPTNGAGRRSRRSANGASAQQRRGGSGQTKGTVLSALSAGEAMTASQVAAATGLGRATVSTTLSKMAKTGEVAKAKRGYRMA